MEAFFIADSLREPQGSMKEMCCSRRGHIESAPLPLAGRSHSPAQRFTASPLTTVAIIPSITGLFVVSQMLSGSEVIIIYI